MYTFFHMCSRTSDVRGEAASAVDRGSAPDEAGATLGAARGTRGHSRQTTRRDRIGHRGACCSPPKTPGGVRSSYM